MSSRHVSINIDRTWSMLRNYLERCPIILFLLKFDVVLFLSMSKMIFYLFLSSTLFLVN